MNRVEKLRDGVVKLYEAKTPGRADWADWIYEGHVVLVAKASKEIAEKYGGNPELAEAAGLLHDIADTVMKRDEFGHEERSFKIARTLLAECGFNEEEINIVVDDAIAKHSCHGDIRPGTAEGKAMAAGDGVVHMQSDFYAIAEKRRHEFQSSGEISAWALPKIDRDFNNKIAFDDLRESVRGDYERLKKYFS